MSATIGLQIAPGSGLCHIVVRVDGAEPFNVSVPTTLITRNGYKLVLQKNIGGSNTFRWVCRDLLEEPNTIPQGVCFQNTKEGCASFEMYLVGLCAFHSLTMSTTRANLF